MTTAAARETISRESARGNISANLALVRGSRQETEPA